MARSKKVSHDLTHAIIVWRFEDAPEAYRALSTNGGDEDWVAFVPDSYDGYRPGWLESGGPFGCYDVKSHDVPGGTIYIGAHA